MIPGSPVALATDVGAWRVLEPVIRELDRRAWPIRVFLAEPAATIARREGVPFTMLDGPTPEARAADVLAAHPTVLLLGTSAKAVAERALMRRLRGAAGAESTTIPTLAVLDAMLFVERRFGPGLAELPDLLVCPDRATADRLRHAGAPLDRLLVTGNPTLEEIAAGEPLPPPPTTPGQPIDVLFVSSPVKEMRLRAVDFAIDETESLDDLLAVLAGLRRHAPGGFRVRVRLHPIQEAEALPRPPAGIELCRDDDPDRLRSCARARVVVGLSSSLLGEARLLPRPAVAYLPGPFWDRERAFAPEYDVWLARTRADLPGLLDRALAEPASLEPRALHLGAGARIADLLIRLADAPA